MAPTTLHLRSETKALERRSALSPASVKALLKVGYHVDIENSSGRVYKDDEFKAVGATLVPEGSWPNAPKDHIIVGLKELPKDDSPLFHSHIQFGHCYKQQEGWARHLSRFARGGGTLYDIEFLTNETGRRVAAFGYYAGTPLGSIPLYPSAPALVDSVKSGISSALPHNAGQQPRVIIVGALGRCGNRALDFCLEAGVPQSSILKWDMAKTARGGPFHEISTTDIFINCIYLGATPIPPFVTYNSLSEPGRRLRVACDVSCNPNNAYNPVPIYTDYSTFKKPTLPVLVNGDGPDFTMVSIDHLPSLVAREASDEFSSLLLPSLETLDRRSTEGVWRRAQEKYLEVVKELPVEN